MLVVGRHLLGQVAISRSGCLQERPSQILTSQEAAGHERKESHHPIEFSGSRGRVFGETAFEILGLDCQGRHQQILLAAKASIKRAEGDTCIRGDVAQSNRLETAFFRQFDRSFHDPPSPLLHLIPHGDPLKHVSLAKEIGFESRPSQFSAPRGIATKKPIAPGSVSSSLPVMPAASDPASFCSQILESGDLASKLQAAPDFADVDAARSVLPQKAAPDYPTRDAGLRMRTGAGPLPRPGALGDPRARARCLARFAHHELMAVELFAWAILRWPGVDEELKRGWLQALGEEQMHCRLYLGRLEAHGSRLEEHLLSDYFWKHVPAIAASAGGPRAFLAAMGMTLEQANLDFALLYRDAFRVAGDGASAAALQRVYDDEVRHVALARDWLMRLSPEYAGDQIAAYEASVPFPLAAHRAKGRRFDLSGRRAAGLSESLIEYVRSARSSQELAGKSTLRRDSS